MRRGGTPLGPCPNFGAPFPLNAFLVNKKSPFPQKSQCFELWTVFGVGNEVLFLIHYVTWAMPERKHFFQRPFPYYWYQLDNGWFYKQFDDGARHYQKEWQGMIFLCLEQFSQLVLVFFLNIYAMRIRLCFLIVTYFFLRILIILGTIVKSQWILEGKPLEW